MKKPRHLSRRRQGGSAPKQEFDRSSSEPRQSNQDRSPVSTLGTYDEGLLDRVRTHWRLGDWDALVSLTLEQIESHPERAKLAMLMASAWQAKGQPAQTRQLVSLARQWGVDERLLARVLLAGVHNTLGRAMALGGRMRDQALHHFRSALQPAGSVASGRQGLQARIRQEMSSMGVPERVERWLAGEEALHLPPSKGAGSGMVGSPQIVNQFDELGRSLESTLQRELANAVKQIEAYSNLQGYLQSGELMPALHGWPVSPDFALLLVQILEQHEFDAIVEFGSGSSTLLVAKTLANLATRRPRQRRAVQIAFEHLEKYHANTRELLEGAGLCDRVQLELAPLKPLQVQSGEIQRYYDVEHGFAALQSRLSDIPSPRLLVIVDGPPEATGPFARYPALELLLGAFPRQRGAYLMDDYRRPGEQEIARRWQALLKDRGIESDIVSYPLEKMACLLRFNSDSPMLSANGASSH